MKTAYLHFEASLAQGNILASELQQFIQEKYNERIEIVKADENTQDAGAVLAVILGSASLIEIAKGIALWMQKKPEATLIVSSDKERKTIVGTGLKSKDIENILEKM